MVGCNCNAFRVVALDGCYSVLIGSASDQNLVSGLIDEIIDFMGQPAELSQWCWVMICSSW